MNARLALTGGAASLFLATVLRVSEAKAAVSVTVANSDATGQISRFDVAGNALDAHDGTLALFGDTYYLYGTSYGCGYEYRVNSMFCGFKVYSSPDLVHFTDRGQAVPAADCQYCFRPHVIFNASTQTYVMWSDGGGAYHVFTGPSPTGPFARQADPALAVGGAVDEALFVDDDGTGYLIHNTTQVAPNLTADMVVEPLSADYLTTTGKSARLGLGDVEAFALFKRGGVYHALMSDPSCAYCSGGTGEMTSHDMLGPWSGDFYDPNGLSQTGTSEPRQRARLVNADNCGGQPLTVLPAPQLGGDTAFYFMSDRWGNRAPNESLANFFIGPLSFDAEGVLQTIQCVPAFAAALAVGSVGAYEVSAEQDQSSGFDGFHHYCDIAGNVVREQTFVPSRSNVLSAVSVTCFQSGHPNAPLQLDVLDDSGGVLSSESFTVANVSWAPQVLTVHPNSDVVAGRSYTVRLSSATTAGCYGFEYNDTNAYDRGVESYSTNTGASFTSEPVRDLKFTVDVLGTDGGATGSAGEGGAPGEGGVAIGGSSAGGSMVGGGTTNGGSAVNNAGQVGVSGGENLGGSSTPSQSAGSASSGCACRITQNASSAEDAACLAIVSAALFRLRRRQTRPVRKRARRAAGRRGDERSANAHPQADQRERC